MNPPGKVELIVENSPNPSARTVGRVRLKNPCDGLGRAKNWHEAALATAAVPPPTPIPCTVEGIETTGRARSISEAHHAVIDDDR